MRHRESKNLFPSPSSPPTRGGRSGDLPRVAGREPRHAWVRVVASLEDGPIASQTRALGHPTQVIPTGRRLANAVRSSWRLRGVLRGPMRPLSTPTASRPLGRRDGHDRDRHPGHLAQVRLQHGRLESSLYRRLLQRGHRRQRCRHEDVRAASPTQGACRLHGYPRGRGRSRSRAPDRPPSLPRVRARKGGARW